MRRIRTCEENRPSCAFEIEDMAVIQDLVLCLCWPCLAEESEDFDVHVFDLLTESWRTDIKIGRGDSVSFEPLFSLRRHRMHVFNENLMAFVLSSEEISIQICENRQFRLAYIIDISEMWVTFDECINVDGIFFTPNLERIYFYGDYHNMSCVKEAIVDDAESQVGFVRPLKSLEMVEVWQRSDDTNQVIKVVQKGNCFYILEVGQLDTGVISFDMDTRKITVVGLLIGDERIRDLHPTKVYHPFNACWLPGKDRLIVQGVANPHHPAFAWTIIFDEEQRGPVAARWHVNPLLHSLLFQAGILESDPFVCIGDDVLFLHNRNKSFYRMSLQELHGKHDTMRSCVMSLEYLAHKEVMAALDPRRKPEMNGIVKAPVDVIRCILKMEPLVEEESISSSEVVND
ncbi:hypothetical protein PFISCL1PPCAC_330 [Pristionchus fissidentatus]|uniref:DUF295 domain-containing protein n=1 Tax=Pristionchus fissidentatus TaxID=1538716 RepID=A0AAV5UQS4_9BILA|nr:hypothetical protein PFISCL1PPCAC_330 [Pristionchus fissidentatus]